MRLVRHLMLIGALLLFAGSASAGFIAVTYDLTGSTITTTTPAGTDVDPLTGTLVIHFGAATASAPITSATLVSGNTHVTIDQPPPIPITGSSNTVLSPGPGVVGVLSLPNTVAFPIIPALVTGFLHCNATAALCGLAGFPASAPVSVTGSILELPPLVWTGGVANGGFLGTITQIVTQPVTVTVVTNYVGTETSSVFVPEPTTFTLLGSGIAGIALWGALRRRRNL